VAPQLSPAQIYFDVPALAAQSLVLKGTNIGGVPTDAEYLGFVGSVVNGVLPESSSGPFEPDDLVDYPASFWPVSKGGLGDPTWNASVRTGKNNLTTAVAASGDDVLIFGYSQGAVVASQFKATAPDPEHEITYVLLANPNRPNGGFLERFTGITIPILDVTASGATPPEGGITHDIALQYDGWSDFPRFPAHLLSTINAIAGTIFLHGFANQEAQIDVDDLVDPTKTDIVEDGETTYYTVATKRLPILIALEAFVPSPILTALDAPLRVMVEWGYDRSISPGTPESLALFGIGNPIQDVVNLLKAIPTGIDDGLAEAAGDPEFRPLGTTPAGMYGVGGRELPTEPSEPSELSASAVSAAEPIAAQRTQVRADGRTASRRAVAAPDRRPTAASKTASKPAPTGHAKSARTAGAAGR